MNLEARKKSLEAALRVIEVTLHLKGDVGDNVSLWSHPERQIHYIISRMQQEQDIWEEKEPREITTLDCTCLDGGEG